MGKFLENMAERFVLPGNAAAGEIYVTVTGGKSVLIENHKGLLEYSDEVIIMSGGKTKIAVFGVGLSLDAMNGEVAVISGKITSVSFE